MRNIFCNYIDGKCEHCGKLCNKEACKTVCNVLAKQHNEQVAANVEKKKGCGCNKQKHK